MTKWWWLAFVLAGGCVKADLVVVDKKTALEQQAGGDFRGLEEELEQAGVAPRPAPLTRAQVEASGQHGDAIAADDAESAEAQIDGLLVRACLGESLDGTLVETRKSCTGTLDVAQVSRVVERANRDRYQVWRYLQSRRPGVSLDEVRRAWRQVYLKRVVCGGQVQAAGGAWEAKKC